MTSKERFLTALNLGQPDRIPVYDFLFMREIFEAVLGRRPEGYNGTDAVECALKMGYDGIWVPAGGFAGYTPTYVAADTYMDEWGTTFKKNDMSWPIDAPVAYPIKTREDFCNWAMPNPHDGNRMVPILDAVKLAKNRIAILGGVTGPLTTCYFLLGMEEMCLKFYDDIELVEDIMRMSNAYNIPAGLHLAESGADAIIISDDLGYDKGLFISPELMRRYVLPYLFEMVNAFKAQGIPVILHCDGNINVILDDIALSGISGYHPVERKSHMDLGFVKQKYGKNICPIGNVDSSVTLPYGTREEVEAEVKECIRTAGPGGGYIIASDHSLHDGIPMDNIFAMLDAAKRYGKYPLNL